MSETTPPIPVDPVLDNVVIALSHTTEPRNIGAAARALKTMGLSRLALINPEHPRGVHARAVAHGAVDVLEAASIHESLSDAVADALVVAGTTTRRRELRKHAHMAPHDLARRLVEHAAEGPVVLVFGTERTGLTNDEVNLCRYVSTIETAQAQPSLNLAQAVMVYCWEIRKAHLEASDAERIAPSRRPEMRVSHPHQSTKMPSQAQLDVMYDHLDAAMGALDYTPREREKFLTYIRHLHMRAGIVDWETQVYHLMAKRILKALGAPAFRGGSR